MILRRPFGGGGTKEEEGRKEEERGRREEEGGRREEKGWMGAGYQ